jgi:lipopolysaccharide transport system ATP-binding protein
MRGPAKEVCHAYLAALSSEGDQPATFQTGGTSAASSMPDLRRKRFNELGLGNRITIGAFDLDAPWFGFNGGEIIDVGFFEGGERLSEVSGGQTIEIRIRAHARLTIIRALIGFQVRDQKGQVIFGENTDLAYREAPFPVEAGSTFEACFEIEFPYLPTGSYSMVVALSDGTQLEHIHHRWIDDALFLTVDSSHVEGGLVGLPLHQVEIEVVGD